MENKKYVLIGQGIVNKHTTVADFLHLIDERPELKTEFIQIDDPQFRPPWGMGCFELNVDGTIGKCVGAHWDTSD